MGMKINIENVFVNCIQISKNIVLNKQLLNCTKSNYILITQYIIMKCFLIIFINSYGNVCYQSIEIIQFNFYTYA